MSSILSQIFVFRASLLPFRYAEWDVTTKWAVGTGVTRVNAEKCILCWRWWSGVKRCAQNIVRVLGNKTAGGLQLRGNKSKFLEDFYSVFMNLQARASVVPTAERVLGYCFKSIAGSCCKRQPNESLMENLAMIELFPRSKNWFWSRSYRHKSFTTASVKSFHAWKSLEEALQWKIFSCSVDFPFTGLFSDWKVFPQFWWINSMDSKYVAIAFTILTTHPMEIVHVDLPDIWLLSKLFWLSLPLRWTTCLRLVWHVMHSESKRSCFDETWHCLQVF